MFFSKPPALNSSWKAPGRLSTISTHSNTYTSDSRIYDRWCLILTAVICRKKAETQATQKKSSGRKRCVWSVYSVQKVIMQGAMDWCQSRKKYSQYLEVARAGPRLDKATRAAKSIVLPLPQSLKSTNVKIGEAFVDAMKNCERENTMSFFTVDAAYWRLFRLRTCWM